MGIVRFRHELANQSGETVMWMENPILFARRKDDAA
jgi:acyl dehydratase